jgi:CheY-like chemotaxis protein
MENNLRVLVVEDLNMAAKVAGMVLKEVGCAVVDFAVNGKEAIEKSKNGYDLILMDIGLPDMDGYTVTETIRSMEKKPARVTIVALTAHAADEMQDHGERSGMDDFLEKPLTVDKCHYLFERYKLV